MCTLGRWIKNKYTGHSFFVKCGHCEACQQEKANKRTQRLKAELSDGHIALFVTLTYNRFFCPFVRVSDVLAKVPSLNIYRECQVRRNSRNGKLQIYNTAEVLDTIQNPVYDNIISLDTKELKLKTLKHRNHNIGVIYYPDIQNFIKRLRIILTRNYNYYGHFKVFNCAEYGETTQRPHFHCLIFIEATAEKLFRQSIVQAWPFANQRMLQRGIEIARNAASYVSSYVNCGSDFPAFLKNNFRPKHSFSKGLGMGLSDYQLDSVLEKIRQGDLRHFKCSCGANGIVYAHLPIPKYVINRYFPIFKGYSRIAVSEIHNSLLYPRRLFEQNHIEYTQEDVHKITVRLMNAYDKYFRSRMSYEDYAYLYDKAWCVYRSTCYRHFMECDDIPLLEKYDNIFECLHDRKYLRVHPSFDVPFDTETNPNYFGSVQRKTSNLTQLYHQKLKTKRVNNIVMSNLNYQF